MRRAPLDRSVECGIDSNEMEEIRRAIELMRHVQIAHAEQAEKALEATEGNVYILPEPLTLRVGDSA